MHTYALYIITITKDKPPIDTHRGVSEILYTYSSIDLHIIKYHIGLALDRNLINGVTVTHSLAPEG